jgi:aminoglycoside/choline kinase family phosphotransferase
MNDPNVHCKCLNVVPDRDAYVEYYRRLEAARLGPTIVAVTTDRIRLERLETLREWITARSIDGHLPAAPRRLMSLAIVELLETVHELGFCHRDTHVRNFVVRDDAPLLVDPKYAIASRGRSCYDLEGPGDGRIEIAHEHRCQANRNRCGVWWENADPISEALASTFGSVAELRAG